MGPESAAMIEVERQVEVESVGFSMDHAYDCDPVLPLNLDHCRLFHEQGECHDQEIGEQGTPE